MQAEDDPVRDRSRMVAGKTTNKKQIVIHEAVPYHEFQCTPYGVLMCTSWGGHLGWFELGGGRWFVNPVCNEPFRFVVMVD